MKHVGAAVLATCMLLGGVGVDLQRTAAYAASDPATVGQWNPPEALPVVPIHAALLPTGKLLVYSFPGSLQNPEAYVCDPVAGACSAVPVTRPLFCSGHAMMPDGRLLVTGGRAPGDIGGRGIKDTHVFDPGSETWTRVEDMAQARWYPTNVTLGDGRVAAAAGNDEFGEPNPDIELYQAGSSAGWALAGAQQLPVYPWLHVLSSGNVFYAGPSQETAVFSTNTWSPYGLILSKYGTRNGGISVLLPGPPDRVMIMGGQNGGVVTATAETINLADASPAWRYTQQPMNFARMHANAVILPDGTVLVIGGHSQMHEEGGPEGPPPSSVYEAELFDPATETWSVMASMQVARVYHSTALLLPDGRVVAGGSTGIGALGHTAEIYSPPYLFRGPRPVITAAPTRVAYGESFQVESPNGSEITSVVLVRLASVTHSVNTDQRHVDVGFTYVTGTDTLLAVVPLDPATAPPGYYMLFVLNTDGVPSTAEMVQVSADGALYVNRIAVKRARSLTAPNGSVRVKGALATQPEEDFLGAPAITVDVDDALGFSTSHTWTVATDCTVQGGSRLKCTSSDENSRASFKPSKKTPATFRVAVRLRGQAIDPATQLAGPVTVRLTFGPPPPPNGSFIRADRLEDCRTSKARLKCRG